jgi:hypothetical protein
MAVYNGFSTRKKESVYNELTFDLISRLQEGIIAEMNGKELDLEGWKKGKNGEREVYASKVFSIL